MELFDKDGKPVEGAMTKDEHEAALGTAVEAAKTEAVDAYKAENPPAEEKKEEKKEEGEKPVAEVVSEAVAAALRTRDIADMAKAYAPADPAKQKEIIENAGRLQGYELTPEGLASQVEAAAKIAGIDTEGVDISGLAATGGNKNVDTTAKTEQKQGDAELQAALGIKPEDAEKYAGKDGGETKTT